MARLYAAKKDYSKASESYKEAIQAPGQYPETALLEQELASLNIQLGAAAPNQPAAGGGSQ